MHYIICYIPLYIIIGVNMKPDFFIENIRLLNENDKKYFI